MTIIFRSTITCPVCGYSKEETMPVDSCQFLSGCENCRTLLKPEKGDCSLVFVWIGQVPPGVVREKHFRQDYQR